MMNDYCDIMDVLRLLTTSYDWSHSFVRECYFMSDHMMVAYVDDRQDSHVGDVDGPLHIRLVVATAGNDANTGVEFLFTNVVAFSIETLEDLSFQYRNSGNLYHTASFAGQQSGSKCYIQSQSIRVRFLGKTYLGANQLLGHPFPTPRAVVATKVEGCWRQCKNCGNIWEEVPNVEFSRCSNCGEVTRLATE